MPLPLSDDLDHPKTVNAAPQASRPDSDRESRRNLLFLLGCMLVQLIVFYGLFADKSFWLDEILSLHYTGGSPGDLLRRVAGDLHPPGFFLTLWGWRRLVPASETALRQLPMLASLLVVVPLFALMRRVASARAAYWACLLLTCSAFHAQFAAELRMYSALELMTVLGCLLLLQGADPLASPTARRRAKLAYAFCALACLYLHYYGFFIVAGQALFLVLRGEWRRWKGWAWVYLAIFLGFLPWTGVLWRQMAAGGPAWTDAVQPLGASFQMVVNTLIYFNLGEWGELTGPAPTLTLMYLTLPAVTLGVWQMLRGAGRRGVPESALIPLLFGVTFYLALTASQVRSIFFSRYFVCVLPCFYALMGVGVAAIERRPVRWVAGLALLAFLGFGMSQAARMRPREDWREAVRFIHQTLPPDGARWVEALCDNPNTQACVEYYLTREKLHPGRLALLPAVPPSQPAADSLPLACVIARTETLMQSGGLQARLPGYQLARQKAFKGGIIVSLWQRQPR